MSFVLTFLIVFAFMSTTALLSVRRFFLTTESGAYVFVAINWTLLLVATAIFALLIQLIQRICAR